MTLTNNLLKVSTDSSTLEKLDPKEQRLRQIMKYASKLKWIRPIDKSSYPLMELSEVEKCMLAMVDDTQLERLKNWANDDWEKSILINKDAQRSRS